jgi:uncharacterized iron-regulated membrane protein
VLALSGAALVFGPEIDAATRPPGASPQRSIVEPIRSLHASFHAGRAGAAVVGVLGLVLAAEGITGLWLYGRLGIRRRAGARRPSARRIHRVLGGVSLVFAAIVGVTGAVLALAASTPDPSGVHELVRRLHGGDFLGWSSRIVYAVVGVTLPILSITGYLLVARRPG